MKNIFTKGISVLEILIVVGILSLLFAIVLPSFSEMRNSQIAQNNALIVFNALNKAKSNTISSLDNQQYGVHFETNQVIIFTGSTYDPNHSNNEVVELYAGGQLSTINLSGGGSDVYFARLTGAPSKSGTLTVTSGQRQKTVNISPTGSFSVN